MKKKNLFIVLLCVFALICTSVAPIIFQSKINKPLESIDTENLWKITVTKSSDGIKYEIPKNSGRSDFANLIRNLIAEEFETTDFKTKKIADISITEKALPSISLNVYEDRIIIDSVTYKAESNSLNALITAIENINQENANAIFEYPPELKITSGGKTVDAHQGTSTWSDGSSFTHSDSSHPLMWGNIMEKLVTDTNEAELVFPIEAQNVKVVCYSDKFMGLYPDAVSDDYSYDPITEEVEINGNKINLKSGAFVYEVTASFSGSSWGGTVSYGFYADAP